MRTEFLRASRAAPMVSLGVVWAACAACLSWIFWPLGNWLRYPLVYEGDGLWNLFVIKTVFETGWYASNDHLGAPFSATFLDFAKPESLYLLMFRLAGLVTSNVMLVHNLFYFLGFFLAAASALLVLRNGFRLQWALAIAGALLYAFLPFHLMRQQHLFLSNYFVVPIAVWMALLVSADNPPFFPAGRLGRAGWPVWLAAAAVLASVGAYYAFFAIFLIAAMGCLESVRTMLWRNAASAMLLCTLVASCLAANFTPSLVYSIDQGANKHVATRNLKEIDVYALQPIQLLLPTKSHRLPAFSELGRQYDASALLVNENRSSYLGIVASVGFLLLLVTLVAGHRVIREHHNFGVAARINAIALSLAVAGGGGMVLGLIASPQFRALNRISVVIAFVSIAGFLMVLQKLLDCFPAKSRALTAAASVLLVAFGLWDQVPLNVSHDIAQLAAEFDSDRAFVRDIEARLPAESLILQWPYTPFPEAAPRFRETPYALFRGYLHATTLRWSYGGMQGRKSDLWHASLAQLPLAEQIEIAKSNGFRGVWLDRRALKDGGMDLESRLRALGIVDGHESIDHQLVFYSLISHGSFPPDLLSFPILGTGFYGWEGSGESRWAWNKGDSSLVLLNHGVRSRRVRLAFAVNSLVERPVEITLGTRMLKEFVLPQNVIKTVELELDLPPGRTEILLRSSRPAVRPGSADPRLLATAIRNLKLTPL